jgi:hypothetical protein
MLDWKKSQQLNKTEYNLPGKKEGKDKLHLGEILCLMHAEETYNIKHFIHR